MPRHTVISPARVPRSLPSGVLATTSVSAAAATPGTAAVSIAPPASPSAIRLFSSATSASSILVFALHFSAELPGTGRPVG
ncbi:hypothetical protein GCM10010452_66230 [Crossiella cryophila]